MTQHTWLNDPYLALGAQVRLRRNVDGLPFGPRLQEAQALGLDGQVLLPIDQKLQPFVPAPDQAAGVFPFHIPGNQPLSHQSLAAIGRKILQRHQNHFCARCPL